MRRDLSKPEVPLSIRLNPYDRADFARLLPMSGSQTWAVEIGMTAFLDLTEKSEQHQLWVKHQIAQMMYGERKPEDRPNLVAKFNANIPTPLYVRFGKLFPEPGSLSWFIRRFIHDLCIDLSEGPTLEERIEASVNRSMQIEATPEEEQAEIIHQGPDE